MKSSKKRRRNLRVTFCGRASRCAAAGHCFAGFDELLEKETGVPVRIADDPLTCVARGLGQIMDDFETHRELLDNPLKPLSINL